MELWVLFPSLSRDLLLHPHQCFLVQETPKVLVIYATKWDIWPEIALPLPEDKILLEEMVKGEQVPEEMEREEANFCPMRYSPVIVVLNKQIFVMYK